MSDQPDDDPNGNPAGPIHPDDRLWRHPSELGLSSVGTPSGPGQFAAGSSTTTTRRPQVAAVLLYGTAALLLMGGVWWASDQMTRRDGDETATLSVQPSATSSSVTVAAISQFPVDDQPAPHGAAKRLGVATKWTKVGLVIVWIGDDSAADAGGLEVGDIVVSVDGFTAATPDDLIQMVNGRDSGDTMTIRIDRAGESMSMPIVLD